ncbi:hypothetical protein LUZ60_012531 [Juncus effusus]|nr:hypothetical protein LUZ60_012531 [Juncus effusus]
MGETLADIFIQPEFGSSPEDLFNMLETLQERELEVHPFCPNNGLTNHEMVTKTEKPLNEDESRVNPKKRGSPDSGELMENKRGSHKMSHITVERNRRKQMNEHLTALRSLMPCFYVKRGDQASIIGGVVDYIKELQLVLQSLEAKKQRKVYSEVLSPKPTSSPRIPISPTKLPLSPKLGLPISPGTPQPGSPYKPRLPQNFTHKTMAISTHESSLSFENTNTTCTEFGAVSSRTQTIPDVKVEFLGPNVILKTASQRIPGQPLKIIAALESLSLEILNVSISSVDDTMLNSFTIKIGIECELSIEDLVQEIRQTFS